jgi:hypothetical protein
VCKVREERVGRGERRGGEGGGEGRRADPLTTASSREERVGRRRGAARRPLTTASSGEGRRVDPLATAS